MPDPRSPTRSGEFQTDNLDLSRPLVAAEYLKICRSVLAEITLPEAVGRFLNEIADQFDKTDPELAAHLREQSLRLGPEEGVRHSVRRGIPPLSQVREQVGERLRREEDRRRAAAMNPAHVGQARGCLLTIGALIALILGGAVWGILWVLGLDVPWGPLAGGTVALVLFVLFWRAVERLMPLWTGQSGPSGG
jgi:hypothetical protein